MTTTPRDESAESEPLLLEEVRLLRHQLAQADRRLAVSERRVLQLQAAIEDAQSQAQRAQKQLRDMRSHPSWKATRAVLSTQERVQETGTGMLRALRGIKRKIIG